MIIFQFSQIVSFLLRHKKVEKILYGFIAGGKKRLLLINNIKEEYNKIIDARGLADDTKADWLKVEVSGFSLPVFEIKDYYDE